MVMGQEKVARKCKLTSLIISRQQSESKFRDCIDLVNVWCLESSWKVFLYQQNSETSVPIMVHKQEKKIRGPFSRGKASVMTSMA